MKKAKSKSKLSKGSLNDLVFVQSYKKYNCLDDPFLESYFQHTAKQKDLKRIKKSERKFIKHSPSSLSRQKSLEYIKKI